MEETRLEPPNIAEILQQLDQGDADFDSIFSKLPQKTADQLTIIGGQSLAIWADNYLINEMSGEEYNNVTSFDLDLLGNAQSVKECAIAWGGRPILPEPLDSTPNSGLVQFTLKNGNTANVDFLKLVQGLSTKEVQKYSDVVVFGGIEVPILTPPLCLKSRLSNLHDLRYGPRKSAREVIRIKLAASACRSYLLELLESDEIKKALKVLNYLIRAVLHTNIARSAVRKYDAEILHSIPELHSAWPEKTRTIVIPKRIDELKRYYSKKLPPPPSHQVIDI